MAPLEELGRRLPKVSYLLFYSLNSMQNTIERHLWSSVTGWETAKTSDMIRGIQHLQAMMCIVG